jgi:hypothetical protein
MSDSTRPFSGEPLQPDLERVVEIILAEPVDEEAVARVKVRAQQLARAGRAPRRQADGPAWTATAPRKFLGKGLLAAAALLALATAAVLWDQSAGRAFEQVVQRVKAARNVQFATTTRLGMGREATGRMYLMDNRLRFEQFDGALVQIGDLDAKRVLMLNTQARLAQSIDVTEDVAQSFANPIEQLRRATAEDAQRIGQEIIKGRRTDVYRLRRGNVFGIQAPEMLVWVDVASELPARVIVRDPDPKAPTEFRFDDFAWNEPLDESLFALDAPAGFETGVVVKSPHPTDAADRTDSTDGAPPEFVNGVLRYRVPGHIHWHPNGKTITALMRDPESAPTRRENELGQWDVATGKQRWLHRVAGAGRVAIRPDGELLATIIGYEVQLRHAATGEITKAWTSNESLSPLAFSPNGKSLAAGITEWGPHGGRGGDPYGGVQIWDIERGALVTSWTDDEPTTFVAFAPDGNLLASSSNAGPIKLWDATTGALARILPGRSRGAFSPDGQTFACISPASPYAKVGRLDLYQVGDASFLRSLTTAQGPADSWLLAVAFSPDGQTLAATDWNGTVTLWDLTTGNRKPLAVHHEAGVLTAAFSPDGARLATGSEDQTLRLWTLPSAATSD